MAISGKLMKTVFVFDSLWIREIGSAQVSRTSGVAALGIRYSCVTTLRDGAVTVVDSGEGKR